MDERAAIKAWDDCMEDDAEPCQDMCEPDYGDLEKKERRILARNQRKLAAQRSKTISRIYDAKKGR